MSVFAKSFTFPVTSWTMQTLRYRPNCSETVV